MIYDQIKQITKMDLGWSGDEKYKIVTNDNKAYLLRIASEKNAPHYKEIFDLASQIKAPICAPIEYGECDMGTYTIFSWIDGEDAEGKVPTLDKDTQYALGVDAGKILREIHKIPAPDTLDSWEVRFGKKIDKKIKAYDECALKYENGEKFKEFINENRHLLKDRPQAFQHGDYHIGNMMIENGKLIVIDFDRYDFGDPWQEMNRIVWSVQASKPFAKGTLDGYFDNKIPEEFWRLLALYICTNTLSSLPWAIPFGEKEITTMKNQAKEVLFWYNDMKEIIPKWYYEE